MAPGTGVREFRRLRSGLMTSRFIWILASFVGANCLYLLYEQQWMSAIVGLAVTALVVVDRIWEDRTPLIRVTSHELIVARRLRSPRRIPLSTIERVDDSRPAVLTLVVRDGKDYVIPLDWFEWDERPALIETIKAAFMGTRT